MPIPLRTDFSATQVRAAAKKTKDGPQARRLLALAAIYDGGTRSDAAKIGGVTLQIVRDRVLKFNAEGAMGLLIARRLASLPGSKRRSAPPLLLRSRVALFQRSMALCAGVSSTYVSGCSRNIKSASPRDAQP